MRINSTQHGVPLAPDKTPEDKYRKLRFLRPAPPHSAPAIRVCLLPGLSIMFHRTFPESDCSAPSSSSSSSSSLSSSFNYGHRFLPAATVATEATAEAAVGDSSISSSTRIWKRPCYSSRCSSCRSDGNINIVSRRRGSSCVSSRSGRGETGGGSCQMISRCSKRSCR